jgi:glutathione S-transferase
MTQVLVTKEQGKLKLRSQQNSIRPSHHSKAPDLPYYLKIHHTKLFMPGSPLSLYAFPSLITSLALVLYLVVTLNVGRARMKYGVMPPAMTGDPNFERVLRVQQNTLEQMILFLPALWLFSIYVNPFWGAGVGGGWIVGRVLYAWGYYQEAKKRGPGFGISFLSMVVLLLGALIGPLLALRQG